MQRVVLNTVLAYSVLDTHLEPPPKMPPKLKGNNKCQ
jgi:hypothetical protein